MTEEERQLAAEADRVRFLEDLAKRKIRAISSLIQAEKLLLDWAKDHPKRIG